MPSQITPLEQVEFKTQTLEAQLDDLLEITERLAKQASQITGLDLEKGDI